MRLTNKIHSDNLHKRLEGYRKGMKRKDISASMNPAFEDMAHVGHHELVYEKLGQLEDIEEELGIDFLLLDKICQKGVYCFKESIKNFKSKRYGEISHIQNSDIHIQFFGVYKEKRMGVSIMGYIESRNSYYTLPIQDYGKTWALRKEDLE